MAIQVLKKFKENGALISFDVNYRANLWGEDEARETIKGILPLVDVTFGVGAGAGNNSEKKSASGAGGLGGKMTPSAVLVIKNGSTKLVNIKNQDTVTKILDMIPDIVDKFTQPKEKEEMSDAEVVDIAFPEEEEKTTEDK